MVHLLSIVISLRDTENGRGHMFVDAQFARSVTLHLPLQWVCKDDLAVKIGPLETFLLYSMYLKYIGRWVSEC